MLHIVPASSSAAASSISRVQSNADVAPGESLFADFLLEGSTGHHRRATKRAKRAPPPPPPPPPLDLRVLLLHWHTFAAALPKKMPITQWVDYFLSMYNLADTE